MAVPVAALAKLTAAALSDEDTRRKLGWIVAAICSPLILTLALVCSLLSGSAEHNKSAVLLCFNGGNIPGKTPTEYVAYIEDMRRSFTLLDNAIAAVNDMTEGSDSLDGIRVKAVFYAIFFGEDAPSKRAHKQFVDCFVTYEERTRTITDEDGTETEESYTVAIPVTSDQSKPTDYYLTDTDLPLDDAARLRAAPDFLTAEQQTLYRQAFALYSAMFDGETTGIDDAFPAAGGQTEYDEYTPDGSDYTYISSHSRWQSWADFDRVIHALFTDTFWSACNDDGNAPIYIEHDGRLFILDCAYGDQYYNSNIPDEFTLTAQTDDRIDFTVTAHYSYPYPRQDETEAERDERLETSYEYTRTYPVTLVHTDAGWRFEAFTTPNQADMQLLGEWDGVEETDFYLPNN